MSTVIDKPDIVSVIEAETGDHFRGKGQALWLCCPFHSEKTPSFKVNPDRQAFYCFGCGAKGNVITFIERLKGFSFKEAKQYLGIQNDRPYKPDPEKQRKRELLEKFRQWERDYFDEVSTLYRAWNKIKPTLKTPDQVERFADVYKQETVWEHHLDILSFVGDDPERDREKFELYQAVMAQERETREREARIDRTYEKLKVAKRNP